MDYIALLKKSLKITLKNRFLWIFGLFIGGATGFNIFNYADMAGTKQPGLPPFFPKSVLIYLQSHLNIVTVLMIVILIVSLIWFIFSVISQGSLISATARLNSEEKSNFKTALVVGQKYFGSILGLGIIYALIVLFAVFLLILPILIFILTAMPILAIFWGFFAAMALAALIVLIVIMAPYSYRIMVLKNKNIGESMVDALHFVKKYLIEVILVNLSLLLTGLVFSILFCIGFILVGLALFAIGTFLWYISQFACVVYTCLAALVLSAIMAATIAAYSTFKSVVITLSYEKLQLKK